MPGVKTITVRQSIPYASRLGKILWKLAGGKVGIYDSTGAFIHHVELTHDEQAHLRNGGKIVLIHACGTEVHVKI